MSREDWRAVEAEIVNCSLSWLRSDHGNVFTGQPASSTYTADYVYEVDGKAYRHSMILSAPGRVGEKFELRYDPRNPDRNDAPYQTLNVRDSRSVLRHALIWGGGLLVAYLLKSLLPCRNEA